VISIEPIGYVRSERRELLDDDWDRVPACIVVDIKPIMVEFLPRGSVRQPEWSRELMRDYWRVSTPARDA